ncbi:Ran GTPase-binding protein MOG1 KNAG_0B00130 [Huiozyma naganishii CBS 8797]|uniref:Nuclear import protein MOG1 n=1 Tax=Huiozyma naganishii (strain ATCC MYA-139 / BCRC 22969 / CBS 8797 / KCTC 17520 / NBRC 10181 / NCYC 3082 / Yp74L-3) TaxID=1071383 RepID=J7RUH0_HUIN7|nr:hypothetical protein KNAG_0B00130 [Kazachstania naganishii CBS 8797]CCK68462.1 hypothetical protein KNAG_0B00130 [Kazachstania naganishii CBS 8797]
MLKTVQLYGGAVSTVVPDGFLDVSLLREVPDTQEVYVNSRTAAEVAQCTDGLGEDESILVDLLQRVDADSDEEALRVHVGEIAELNGSRGQWRLLQREVLEMEQQDQHQHHAQAAIVVEQVPLRGSGRSGAETVVSCIGLIRLEDVATDVVISINVTLQGTIEDGDGDDEAVPPRVAAAFTILKQIISNFKVHDKSLFA